MDPQSERVLLDRLRSGDSSAFDAIHAEYNPRLFGFLVRLSRRRDVAEDLLEETWMRLVARADRLQPDTSLGAWLFTVARNLYRSYCRSRLLEESYAGSLIGLWPHGSPRASPFESTAASEMERRLEASLAALPARYREVLLLVGVEGLTRSEAAAVCGVTAETLRKRLSLARALLARRMDAAPEARHQVLNEVLP